MPDVDVFIHELQSAFKHFGNHVRRLSPKSGQLCDRCECLDLIYAVECGLKYLILKKYSFKDTSSFTKDDFRNHKLDLMLKECKLDRFHLPSMQLKHPKCKKIACHEFHQALRYGMKIPERELKCLHTKINKLYEHIEGLVGGR